MHIHYITLGSNDIQQSKAFYDSALRPLGYTRLYDSDGMIGYGADAPLLYVMTPHNSSVASHGNGTMIALTAISRAAVDAFHAAALSASGTDEGRPGIREGIGPNFYAAYVRDPDGNKLSAVCEKEDVSVSLSRGVPA